VYAWWRYYPLEWDTNPFYWRWLEIWRWDNALGSIVFCSSKGDRAGDEPLPESIYEPKLLSSYDENQLNIKEKVFISCKWKVCT